MALLAAAIALSIAATAGAQPDVALTVQDQAGTARTSTPVRGGVPFPLGALPDCSSARVTDPAGNELPCAVRPIARWYDGSVKWLLVDTQVSLPAGGQTSLTLSPSAPSAPAQPGVQVTETDEAIAVDTGPARFSFSRARFALPSEAWADLDGDGKWDTQVADEGSRFWCEVQHQPPGEPQEENWLRDAPNAPREVFEAAPAGDYSVQVETRNPLRAVVKLSGWLVNAEGRKLIRYAIRVHACAASSELRVLHTFIYAGKPKEDFTRSMTLQPAPLLRGGNSWALGGSTRHEGRLSEGERVSLFETGPEKIYHLAPYTQDKSVSYSVVSEGAGAARELAGDKEAAGWARLAGDRSAVQLAVRNFWQMHPKELTVDATGVSVGLWPDHGGKVLDLRRRYDEVENVYHYDLSLWPYGGEGVAVSHEMTLRYGAAGQDTAADQSAQADSPLILQCSPQWYASSGAFGPMAAADPAGYPRLEGALSVSLEWIRHNQRAFHWDGMIDYGDTLFHGYATPSHYGYVGEKAWCSRGYVGWLCNDGTLTHSLFLQYLRTGDYGAFGTAEAMVRHVMDVDTCHYCAEDPTYVGGGHRHDQQHWGNGVRGYGTATHGAIDYYLLTGDERALEVAGEYAQFHTDGNMGEDEDRIGGLIRYWEITGDPKWKAKADEVLAQELNVPEGQGWRFATAQHFRFVSNTSVSLLYYLYSAPPADAARLREAIIRSVDFREPAFLSSWDEAGYLPIILASLAYHITTDARYARVIAALIQRNPTAPAAEPVPADLLQTLPTLDFEEMLAVARKWGINNVYSTGIHQMCCYPYAIAALQRAGMGEAAVWAVQRVANRPPAFEEVIDPKSMGKEIGLAYQAGIQHGCPSDIAGGHSDLVLLEDGKPLGPAHSAHADIRKEGGGRYSHWGARTLWFSTSDHTDPRTNGREYKVVYPGEGGDD